MSVFQAPLQLPNVTESFRQGYDLRRRTDYCLLSMKEWQHKAAFVIQIQPDCKLNEGQIQCRVEHVASTRTARFHSVDELLAFITIVLTDVRKTEHL